MRINTYNLSRFLIQKGAAVQPPFFSLTFANPPRFGKGTGGKDFLIFIV
jgi:hypothetical protein